VSRGCEGEDFAECGGLEREGFDDGAVEVEDEGGEGVAGYYFIHTHDPESLSGIA